MSFDAALFDNRLFGSASFDSVFDGAIFDSVMFDTEEHTPTPTPSAPASGGDDVPRRKSPHKGFSLKEWKAAQPDFESTLRETYAALVRGPLDEEARKVVSPYVQDKAIDWAAVARDDEALEQMLELRRLHDEEEAVMLLLIH